MAMAMASKKRKRPAMLTKNASGDSSTVIDIPLLPNKLSVNVSDNSQMSLKRLKQS